MMSESVTVTVHDGQGNPRHPGNKPDNATQPVILEGIQLNLPYFRTLPGIVKILQLVFGLICVIAGSGYFSNLWFTLVAVCAFTVSLLWSMVYLFSLREVINLPINWLLSEFLNTGLFAVLYFTAFIVAFAHFHPMIVAGIFGILNTIAYAAGTYFLYLEYKSSMQ